MGTLHSKTIWFNAVIAVLGVLEMQAGLMRDVVGPEHFGVVMILISAVGAVLRVVTTTALSEK